MVLCMDSGEVEFEGRGALSVHDGLLDLAWFCVCKLGGSLAEDECNFVLVVNESGSALGEKRVCAEVV